MLLDYSKIINLEKDTMLMEETRISRMHSYRRGVILVVVSTLIVTAILATGLILGLTMRSSNGQPPEAPTSNSSVVEPSPVINECRFVVSGEEQVIKSGNKTCKDGSLVL